MLLLVTALCSLTVAEFCDLNVGSSAFNVCRDNCDLEFRRSGDNGDADGQTYHYRLSSACVTTTDFVQVYCASRQPHTWEIPLPGEEGGWRTFSFQCKMDPRAAKVAVAIGSNIAHHFSSPTFGRTSWSSICGRDRDYSDVFLTGMSARINHGNDHGAVRVPNDGGGLFLGDLDVIELKWIPSMASIDFCSLVEDASGASRVERGWCQSRCPGLAQQWLQPTRFSTTVPPTSIDYSLSFCKANDVRELCSDWSCSVETKRVPGSPDVWHVSASSDGCNLKVGDAATFPCGDTLISVPLALDGSGRLTASTPCAGAAQFGSMRVGLGKVIVAQRFISADDDDDGWDSVCNILDRTQPFTFLDDDVHIGATNTPASVVADHYTGSVIKPESGTLALDFQSTNWRILYTPADPSSFCSGVSITAWSDEFASSCADHCRQHFGLPSDGTSFRADGAVNAAPSSSSLGTAVVALSALAALLFCCLVASCALNLTVAARRSRGTSAVSAVSPSHAPNSGSRRVSRHTTARHF